MYVSVCLGGGGGGGGDGRGLSNLAFDLMISSDQTH